MIGRLVRAIRPGEDPQPPGGEAPGTPPSGAARDPEDDDGRGGRGESATGDETDEPDELQEAVFLDADERILVLVSEHDGRLRQQEVVERTDYSPARVSELLCEMEDEGRVNRYWRDGEKIVSFPELGPE